MDISLHCPDDVVYMRWMREGKVVRVARCAMGETIALYPLSDGQHFSLEAFHEADDPGMRVPRISREKITDNVWLAMLNGEDSRKLLQGYACTPCGDAHDGDLRYSYYFAPVGSDFSITRTATFRVCEDMEEHREILQKEGIAS